MNNKELNYSDIILDPEYSSCISRSKLNTSVVFAGREWELGVVPSNMSSCIDFKIYSELINSNHFAIMHRFCDVEKFINFSQDLSFVSISLGVKEKDYKIIDLIKSKGYRVNCITVDIAHGWSQNLKDIVTYIRKTLGNKVFIIGGNISGNHGGVKDLISWGCNAVKVGLSMGKACCTYSVTGYGTPMFSAVKSAASLGFPVIADGQIRSIGDICKSFVAGSSMTMVGSLFAQCSDSPAPIKDKQKIYYGSASLRQRGENKNIEGKDVYMDTTDPYNQFLSQIKQGIQSGMSYGNCKNIKDFSKIRYKLV